MKTPAALHTNHWVAGFARRSNPQRAYAALVKVRLAPSRASDEG